MHYCSLLPRPFNAIGKKSATKVHKTYMLTFFLFSPFFRIISWQVLTTFTWQCPPGRFPYSVIFKGNIASSRRSQYSVAYSDIFRYIYRKTTSSSSQPSAWCSPSWRFPYSVTYPLHFPLCLFVQYSIFIITTICLMSDVWLRPSWPFPYFVAYPDIFRYIYRKICFITTICLMSPIMTLTKAYSMRLRNTKKVQEDMNMSIAWNNKGTGSQDYSHVKMVVHVNSLHTVPKINYISA